MLDRTGRLTWIGALLAAALCAPATASADRYLVDRAQEGDPALVAACTAAPNDCSLRGAVKNAGLSAGPDTITFMDGLTTVEVFPQINVPEAAEGLTIDGGGDITLHMTSNQNTTLLWRPNDGVLKGLAFTTATSQADHLVDIQDGNTTIQGNRFGAAWGSSTIQAATAQLDVSNGISGTVIGGAAPGEGNEFVGRASTATTS